MLTDLVSMESGLRGRNNPFWGQQLLVVLHCLNGVRPKRPEQWTKLWLVYRLYRNVSMESGLRGRNNLYTSSTATVRNAGLNGVRPKRPEQCGPSPPRKETIMMSQWSPA